MLEAFGNLPPLVPFGAFPLATLERYLFKAFTKPLRTLFDNLASIKTLKTTTNSKAKKKRTHIHTPKKKEKKRKKKKNHKRTQKEIKKIKIIHMNTMK